MSENWDENESPDYALVHQYEVLGHQGRGWTEIRIFKKGLNIFVDNVEDYVKTVLQYNKLDCYVGINVRKDNKGHGEDGSGMAEDVKEISGIVFDFDPVREKGAPSTDEQYQEAVRIASAFCREVEGVLVSSGSGAHVYIPINPIRIDDIALASDCLRNYAYTIKQRYSTSEVFVDSTFDLPRVIRCWGTHNSKSNRECHFISGQTVRRSFDLLKYASQGAQASATLSAPTPKAGSERLEERFSRVLSDSSKLKALMNGTAVYGQRAKADYAFCAVLFENGFSVDEVKVLIRRNKSGKASEYDERNLDAEVRRVYAKVAPHLEGRDIVLDEAAYMKDLETRSPGIMTGFPRWDSMTAGLKGGRFYVEAGRPTDGKTTYLVQRAANVAEQGYRVMVFPTECSRASIYDKLTSRKSGVSLKKFQFGNFTSDEKGRVQAAAKEVMKLPIIIVENFGLTLPDVVRAINNYSPDYVIVDFLQCMRYNDVNSSSELGANVIGIKEIGKKRNIPVSLASQLHRKPDNIEDSMSDLKGTGKLEEEGDIVSFIRTVDASVYPCKSKVTILKNKYGEPGLIPMTFNRATCDFKEVDPGV